MNKYRFIVLGSDQNAYGQVRAIYQITHQKVDVIAKVRLSATKYSKLINLQIFPDLLDDQQFVKHMIDLYHEFDGKNVTLFPIPCGDTYVELLSRNSDILKNYFTFPFVDYRLTDQLTNKEEFIKIADEYGLDHPKSLIITPENYSDLDYAKIGGEFPVALKAVDSVKWLDVDFPGRKKAFILNSPAEVSSTIQAAINAGYDGNFILQEFIPGGVAADRVLNCYVDQYHHVKMMNLGHPLLEDPGASAIGNYLAILPVYDQELYQKAQKFLEDINYTGFANFDIKLDPRDRKYKFFEINLRFGRSSFYVNLNGASFPQFLIDDYFLDNLKAQPTQYCNEDPAKHILWLSVPMDVFNHYTEDDSSYQRATELIKMGHFGDTLTYSEDLSLRRKLMIWHFKKYYRKDFKQFGQMKKD
ncbi:carboxylate--amine ligase [Xylocopilactobacillus apicola]|uniref:Carboxylate--amine ligase n=1 Tax=Xylocopilactobacillus apicola TaxID=2932184 RepID=A0AAU9D8V7_9LACO|nr:carboxylate--amine ligase [Xylocopilactobacillus apicola]BDR57895.1 carboxylate--amine ligase [Xylocopilactobacillus apicola]